MNWPGPCVKGDQANLELEFSDVLAWLASLVNLEGVDLEDAMARFRDGCPKCRHPAVRVRDLMALDVRTPTEDDRQAMVDVMRVSLNFPDTWAARRGSLLPIGNFRCAYENGVLKATAAGHRFTQWLGGRSMPMSGIFGGGHVARTPGVGTRERRR